MHMLVSTFFVRCVANTEDERIYIYKKKQRDNVFTNSPHSLYSIRVQRDRDFSDCLLLFSLVFFANVSMNESRPMHIGIKPVMQFQ